MASKARKKKIAKRIAELEKMVEFNPSMREKAEQEMLELATKSHLSLEELFELDELVLDKLEK